MTKEPRKVVVVKGRRCGLTTLFSSAEFVMLESMAASEGPNAPKLPASSLMIERDLAYPRRKNKQLAAAKARRAAQRRRR